MNNKSAKQISNTYKLFKVGTVLAYAVGLVIGVLILDVQALIGICIIVALLMSIKSTFDFLREKTVERVIYEELDAEKFSEIVALGTFGKSKHHKMLAAMYSGDHETVLSLTDENIKKQLNPVEICNSLYKRGFVYFEQEDFDSLAKIVREFNKLKAQHPKFAGIFENYSVFDKFEAKLKEFNGDITRAAVELAKIWRTDKALRNLEALLLVANADKIPEYNHARSSITTP